MIGNNCVFGIISGTHLCVPNISNKINMTDHFLYYYLVYTNLVMNNCNSN